MAIHQMHSALWSIGRWTLVVWAILNGFGVLILGGVERVTQRISQRVPRVSMEIPQP